MDIAIDLLNTKLIFHGIGSLSGGRQLDADEFRQNLGGYIFTIFSIVYIRMDAVDVFGLLFERVSLETILIVVSAQFAFKARSVFWIGVVFFFNDALFHL